jgi:hypothetical protein
MPPEHTKDLLHVLCVRFGCCLTPEDHDSIVADPPTDPLTFAERVIEFEFGAVEPDAVEQMLPCVLAAFEGHAEPDSLRRDR